MRTKLARLWARLRLRRRPLPLGQRGELLAAKFLRNQKYVIVAHSDRDRLGEIDLVAVNGTTVVFVEVKTRRSHDKGAPWEAVDEKKQYQLSRLALSFLKRHDLLECPARFDLVAITWPRNEQPLIVHFKDAFQSKLRGQMFG